MDIYIKCYGIYVVVMGVWENFVIVIIFEGMFIDVW